MANWLIFSPSLIKWPLSTIATVSLRNLAGLIYPNSSENVKKRTTKLTKNLNMSHQKSLQKLRKKSELKEKLQSII